MLGFWSLTLYDEDGFFVQNTLNRYSLGTRDDITKNANGSFTIYATSDPPLGNTNNWLPAPVGEQWIPTLRVYGATEAVKLGMWTYPVITKL